MKYQFSTREINGSLLNILLADRTTGKNIIWATGDYEYLGKAYGAHSEITSSRLTNEDGDIIKPRILKSAQYKKNRVREKAEIFTPSWVCNEQNNLIDEMWFGRANVFNKIVDAKNHVWQSTSEKILFDGGRSWQSYVEAKRLEITCGEAPYLVSVYDTVSGDMIPIENRIGLLDRKFRIVFENTSTESDWLEWSLKAIQSIYGYEFQGDNLFIARKNIFDSYVEYYRKRFNKSPCQNLLSEIAEIISWNLWQMDGLTNKIPYAESMGNLFDEPFDKNIYCIVKDWQNDTTLFFVKLFERRRR